MNLGSLAATALRGVGAILRGASGAPAAAKAAASGPLADVSTAVGAGVAVLQQIGARNLDLSDAESFANAVQQILVDLGVEPGVVLEASKLLEAVAPVFLGAWRSGIVTGGYPDIVAQENDPNFKNR
jgi:hypothetical protein